MSVEIVHFLTRSHLQRIYSQGVCLLRFIDVSGKDSEAARVDHISWFTQTRSYKEPDNFRGEPFVFEWMTFPGYTTMQLLQEIQIMIQEFVTQPKKSGKNCIYVNV